MADEHAASSGSIAVPLQAGNQAPSTHAGTCQQWAGTVPMLVASAQYRPGAGR